MNAIVPRILLVGALLTSSLAVSSAAILSFDFSRTSGDRAQYFGTSQPNGTFDNALNNGGFYVSGGVFKSPQVNGGSNPSTYWAIINDSEPDTANTTLPAGSSAFNVSSSSALTLRTRILSLSSGDAGVASYGGFIIGLSDFSSTASGILAVVERTPSTTGVLHLFNFTNGTVGSEIAVSSTFTYSSSAVFFLDLQIAANGAYKLSLFADSSISGTDNDITRLNSTDFNTATAVMSLTGSSITGYTSGYTGLFFYDAGGVNQGGVDYGNFFMNYTAVPEPGTVALLTSFGIGFCLFRKRSPHH